MMNMTRLCSVWCKNNEISRIRCLVDRREIAHSGVSYLHYCYSPRKSLAESRYIGWQCTWHLAGSHLPSPSRSRTPPPLPLSLSLRKREFGFWLHECETVWILMKSLVLIKSSWELDWLACNADWWPIWPLQGNTRHSHFRNTNFIIIHS